MVRVRLVLLLAASFGIICTSPLAAQDEAESATPAAEAAAATATSPEAEAKAEEQPAADPSGTWTWTREFNGNEMDFVLKLDWDGKKLTGNYTSFDQTSDISEATADDKGFAFVVEREFNGNEFVVEFEGKATDDKIQGTTTVDFGDQPREFEWQAERRVDAEDVVGEWTLRLDTPNGVMEPSITITKTDDGLAGEYESPFGEREVKNLKLDENQLEWEISSDDNDDFDFKVVYKGKPRGNKITGTSEYDFNGNTGELEFTGKRTPPKEEEAVADEAAESDDDSEAAESE